MFQFIILCSIFLFLFYKYVEKTYRFWEERGVASAPAIWPFGSFFYRLRQPVLEYDINNFKEYGKIYGTYNGTEPVLVISDYEIAKQIVIKDFQNFNTRVKFRTYHKMWNENLVFSGFDKWKRIRSIASPAFTTGKLRSMHPLMQKCVDKLIVYLDNVCKENNGIFNTKEVMSGFTMDVIASVAFGTETNANDMRETSSPFVVNGQRLFVPSKLKAIIAFTAPKWVINLFGIEHFLDTEAFDFYIDFARHIVQQRKNNSNYRNDFIQFLLDARVDEDEFNKQNLHDLTASEKNVEQNNSQQNKTTKVLSKKLQLTEDEIIAQSIIFITAGFETTASTIIHAIHELSLNYSIQNKLYEEIKNVLSEQDEYSLEYYERLNTKTPYLEAVIRETLRKYPSLSRLSRICNTDGYQLGDLKLNAGQSIEIMLVAMHRDPEYFPEPEKFIPERFLETNVKELAFMPWGNGPRNCIGMRFALQEIKACLARLIFRYEFHKAHLNDTELKYRKATPFLNCYEFQTKVTLR